MSWNDAVAFCEWLAALSKRKVRLPTEAEWEYACRGGTTTPYYWGGELNGTQANCNGSSPYGTETTGPYLEATSPVDAYAKKFPHPWGLTDVHGNVFEWCEDWLDVGFYARSPKDDPKCGDGPQSPESCVVGPGTTAPGFAALLSATGFRPAGRSNDCGFRIIFNPD